MPAMLATVAEAHQAHHGFHWGQLLSRSGVGSPIDYCAPTPGKPDFLIYPGICELAEDVFGIRAPRARLKEIAGSVDDSEHPRLLCARPREARRTNLGVTNASPRCCISPRFTNNNTDNDADQNPLLLHLTAESDVFDRMINFVL